MYHFLSGYTAKLAGTERGLGSEPKATFSACFGAPFLALHPTVYAEMLGERIARHRVNCWLVNTGWTGGRSGWDIGLRTAAHARPAAGGIGGETRRCPYADGSGLWSTGADGVS